MNIVVIGASQGIGREVVKAGLASGHNVTAFSRHPSAINIQHPRLTLHAGDILDIISVERAIKGHEAVICTLGLPTVQAIGPPLTKPHYTLSIGTTNIITAMANTDVRRLMCVTAVGVGDSAHECTAFARCALTYGLHWLFKEKNQQERLIKKSKLDWTIIRPTALTNGLKQSPLVGEHLRSGLFTHVSRRDVAAIIMNTIDQPESYHKALAVSYPRHFGDSLRWLSGYFGILKS